MVQGGIDQRSEERLAAGGKALGSVPDQGRKWLVRGFGHSGRYDTEAYEQTKKAISSGVASLPKAAPRTWNRAGTRSTHDASRTDLKRESAELQKLGVDMLELRSDYLERLELPDKLRDAIEASTAPPSRTSAAPAVHWQADAPACAGTIAAIPPTLVEHNTPSVQETGVAAPGRSLATA